MLIILLGIVGIVIVFIALDAKGREKITEIDSTTFAMACIAILITGITLPVSGYKDWELKQEYELESLSNTIGAEENIFVTYSEGQYSYRHEIESNFGTNTSKEYKLEAISSKNVEEVEDSKCESPMLYVYERKGKMSIWTFALFAKETKYVFYVPEGTIKEKNDLK